MFNKQLEKGEPGRRNQEYHASRALLGMQPRATGASCSGPAILTRHRNQRRPRMVSTTPVRCTTPLLSQCTTTTKFTTPSPSDNSNLLKPCYYATNLALIQQYKERTTCGWTPPWPRRNGMRMLPIPTEGFTWKRCPPRHYQPEAYPNLALLTSPVPGHQQLQIITHTQS